MANKKETTMAISAAGAALLVQLAQSGRIVAYGEYRLWDARKIEYTSTTTGKLENFDGVTHTVEVGNKAVLVGDNSDMPDLDVDTYVSPYVKGQMVIVEIVSTGYTKGKGERTRGIIHVIPVDKTGKGDVKSV